MPHDKTTVSNHQTDRLDIVDTLTRDNGDVNSSSPRTILAHNLRRMIDAEGSSVRAWAMARGLDVKFIDRLSKGKHAVTVDKLEELAAALNCEPWHLLLPGFDAKDKPVAPLTAEDKAVIERLRRLLGRDL